MITKRVRFLVFALLFPLLAACDDDGTGPERLTGEDVAGFYDVCSLTFTPEGDLPVVAIDEAAFAQGEQIRVPQLIVNPSRTFELSFTPEGQLSDEELRGTLDLGVNRVRARFTTGTVDRSDFLLPAEFTLNFQESPQTLRLERSPVFNVARADFARLAGISESGLAQQIPGRFSARFAVGSCS
jgi:hypothetical protein